MRRGIQLATFALLLVAVGTASAGRVKKTPPIVIGVVLPSSTDRYFAAIQKGVSASAAANGFKVKLAVARRGGVKREIEAISKLTTAPVDALLVVPLADAALNSSINSAVVAGIETATAALDAPGSRRAFFYGPDSNAEGRAQAQRLLTTLHTAKRTGVVEYVITSCLPGAVQQRGRRLGFEAAMRANPYKKEFTVKRIGFYGTTTVPFQNRLLIRKVLAKLPGVDAVYAECAPDTVNWGVALREKKKQGVLVAGHEWYGAIFSLISQGWVSWSLGPSPYDMGYTAALRLFQFESAGTALPKGAVASKSVFATKATLAQIKAGPDYSLG